MDLTILNNSCRSCMKYIKYRNKKKTDSPKTLQMFCFCINVNISDDDNLPKHFCSICANKIEAAHEFITTAKKVDLTIRNLLSRSETSVIVKTGPKQEEAEIKLGPRDRENETVDVIKEDFVLPMVLPHTITIKRVTHTTTDDQNGKGILINEENDFDHHEDNLTILSSESDDVDDKIKPLITSGKTVEKKVDVCYLCNKKFGSRLWFYKHMKREHSNKLYKCEICPKTFTMRSKLKVHLSTHNTERKFGCDGCEKRFRNRTQLNEHALSHSNNYSFKCDVCSKRFKKKSLLRHHMVMHADRKYLCTVCGKDFAGKGNLDTHMRIHTGEKPFKCKDCPKAFNTSSSFRRHERSHRGILPYACETCPQRFTTIGSLGRHRRIHTGELPYQCPYCSTAFVDSWKRKTHLMRAHALPLDHIPRLSRAGDATDRRGRPPRDPPKR